MIEPAPKVDDWNWIWRKWLGNLRDETETKDNLGFSNLKDFGAIGDGVADDTVAVQAAIDAGSPLIAPSGTYKITSQISTNSAVSIWSDGEAIFDCSSITSGTFSSNTIFLFNWTGDGAAKSLASNISKGDVDIEITGHSLAVGDVIVLVEDSAGSWADFTVVGGGANSYKDGEIAVIREVVDVDKFKVEAPLYASYTTVSAQIYNPTMNENLYYKNITFLGADASYGSLLYTANFNRFRNCVFDNVRFTSDNDRTVSLFGGLNNTFINCNVTENTGTISANYGVVLSETQDTKFIDCDMFARRHAIATGGANVVTRNTQIIGGSYHSDNSRAIDAHGGTEYFSILGAMIEGFTLGGDHIKVHGCTIYKFPLAGTCGSIREIKGTSIEVTDNNFIANDYGAVGNTGLIFDCRLISSATDRGGVIKIHGNSVEATNSTYRASPQYYISIENAKSTSNPSIANDIVIDVRDNSFYADNDLPLIKTVNSASSGGADFEALYLEGNTTALTSTAWAAGTTYALGDVVLGTTTPGLYFTCTTAGTSHATTEPTWDVARPGTSTTADNTVTWTVYAKGKETFSVSNAVSFHNNQYHEGVYTPVIAATGGGLTLDSTVDTLGYQRRGRVCKVTGMLQLSANTNPGTTSFTLTLPFDIEGDTTTHEFSNRTGGGVTIRIPSGRGIYAYECSESDTNKVRIWADPSTMTTGGSSQMFINIDFIVDF